MPYYLSYFINNKKLFDVDLFSRTFDMELPIDYIRLFYSVSSGLVVENGSDLNTGTEMITLLKINSTYKI